MSQEEISKAIMADLGRARQDELPLSSEERRPSFAPSAMNKQQLARYNMQYEGIASIQDDEAEQMRGLTNLNTRPWASSGLPMASTFDAPKSSPATSSPQKNQTLPATAAAKPSSERTPRILDAGKCWVLCEDNVVVKDASYFVSVHEEARKAFFTLAAPDKPKRNHNVLQLAPPAMHGTFCVIQGLLGKESVKYLINPYQPATAEQLLKTMKAIQITMARSSSANKPSVLPTPSPSPEPAPAPASTSVVSDNNQLIDLTPLKNDDQAVFKVEEMMDRLTMIVRYTYYQLTGSPVSMSPTMEADGLELAKKPSEGHANKKVDAPKQCLHNLMRFLDEERIKLSRAEREPIMSMQNLQVFQDLDSGLKNHQSSPAVSSKANNGGLNSSLWAK